MGYHKAQLWARLCMSSIRFIGGIRKLELCISELNNWMCLNKLKLNSNKTEFFVAGTMQTLSTLSPVELKVGDSIIKPSDTS